MSHVVDHVNEAQLHAYLDRDLEFANPDIRNAVGAHIADCSKCSALLKEVRLVYKASNDLLDVTAPPARPTPSFKDIVKRAADRQSRAVETESPSPRFGRSYASEPENIDDVDIDIQIDDSENDVEVVAENIVLEELSDPDNTDDLKIDSHNEDSVQDVEVVAERTDLTTDDVEVGGERTELQVHDVEVVAEIAELQENDVDIVTESVELKEDDVSIVAGITELQEDNIDIVAENIDIDVAETVGVPEENIFPDDAVDALEDSAIEDVAPEALLKEPAAATEETLSAAETNLPTVVEIHPTAIDVDLPSAEEVVFIQPETNLVEDVAPLPAPQDKAPQPKPKRGRSTRILAMAATIVVAVGIGGWFGRPYIMARFTDAPPVTMAAMESQEQTAPLPQTTDPNALRQELQESAALNSPSENRQFAADAPAIASGAAGEDRADSTAVSLDDRTTIASEAEGGIASSLVGRTIVGNVRDATSKRAVPGARVALAGTGQEARTDSQGRFQITGVPAGSVSVDVVGVGYEPIEKGLSVSDSQGTIADFELRRSVQVTDQMAAAPERAARSREADLSAPALRNDAATWTETSLSQAERVLGGPLIAVEGIVIEQIERAQGQAAVRISQTARNGNPIYLQIISPGNIGDNATLESVEVTSEEGTMPATGRATYGNYLINVEAMVSDIELESLIRRITLAPNVN